MAIAKRTAKKSATKKRATNAKRTNAPGKKSNGRKTLKGPRTAKHSVRAPKKVKSANSSRRWSQHVTETSDALDLKGGVFKLSDPKKIAASLKRSAEHSARRKSGAYRSAVSMLTFYINRAGKGLPKTQRARLERAKEELKRQFNRN